MPRTFSPRRTQKPTDPSQKLLSVDLVAIPDQVLRRLVKGKRLDDLLGGPGGRWSIGDVEVHDLSTVVAHDQKAVKEAKCHCRNDEEVDRGDLRCVVLQERAPALRRRWPPLRHVLRNRRLRDLVPEESKLGLDSRSSPSGMLQRYRPDEPAHLEFERRPSLALC